MKKSYSLHFLFIIFSICKIVGVCLFSIKQENGFRKLIITKFDKLRILLQIILTILIIYKFSINIDDEYLNSYGLIKVFHLVLVITTSVLYILPIVIGIFQRKIIFALVLKFDSLNNKLNKFGITFDSDRFKKTFLYLFLFGLICYFMFSISDVLLSNNIWYVTYYSYSSILTIVAQFEMISFLMLEYIFVQTINDQLLLNQNVNFIKMVLKLHYKLYCAGNLISRGFDSLILSYLNAFFSVSVSMIMIFGVEENVVIVLSADLLFWMLACNCGVFFIVFYAWKSKTEV